MKKSIAVTLLLLGTAGGIMRRVILALAMLMFAASLLGTCARADDQAKSNPINWQDGPTVGKLGDVAQIVIPQGYRFTGKEGAQKLLELTQNPTDGDELGALIPETNKDDDFWFVIFEFDASGYVRDEDKDKLDADAMFDSIRKATEESNKIREQKGWPAFHVVGWSHSPYYDAQSHDLTWAILGSSQTAGKPAEQAVNYSIRLLGRRGVVKADLVLAPSQVDGVFPKFQGLLSGFTFVPGQTYGDWRKGDKVAEYGLTALVVGGTTAALVKSGLLLKFWKLIVAGFVAFMAFLKRIFAYFKRLLTGKAGEEKTPQQG